MNSYTLMVILQIKNAFIFIQKSAEDIKRLDFMENSISAAICSVLEFLLQKARLWPQTASEVTKVNL